MIKFTLDIFLHLDLVISEIPDRCLLISNQIQLQFR